MESKKTITASGFSKERDDMKRWNQTLNAVMITSVSITVARILVDYVYLNILRPDVYAMQSAPWYTAGLLYCVITLALVTICIIIKAIIKHRQKECNGKQGKGSI